MKHIGDNYFNYDINKNYTISGLTSELKAQYVNFLFNRFNKSIICVFKTLYEANEFYKVIENYNDEVLLFPCDDLITTEVLASSPELKLKRVDTLTKATYNQPKIIVSNLNGYIKKLPEKKEFTARILSFFINKNYSIEKIIEQLDDIGYKRELIVNKTGEYGARGFVLDIFPINYDNPIRLEFFDNLLESIRIFDVDTQLTIKEEQKVTIFPTTDDFGDNGFLQQYFNDNIVIYDNYHEINTLYERTYNQIECYNFENDKKVVINELPKLLNDSHRKINFSDLDEKSNLFCERIHYNSHEINDKVTISTLLEYCKKQIKNNKKLILTVRNQHQLRKMIEYFSPEEYIITNLENLNPKKLNIVMDNMTNGFVLNDCIVITINDLILNNSTGVKYNNPLKTGTKLKDLSSIVTGDYVVHSSYGIGKYVGLKTLDKNGLKKDYLQIEYKGGDKLYIPVENIEYLNKYSSSDGQIPKLNKLGSGEWEKTKLRARQKIKSLAVDLIKLYAEREKKIGIKFNKDDINQLEFEKQFPYKETVDQLNTSEEIKKDMESSHPMDRLLCGDVGYGKTEVAFRAAFKAVLSRKQVAFLCPTTILSNQHYNNALERFKEFPVNIELMNRFVNQNKSKSVIEGLKNGRVDIVFGTHRLLSNDVKFKDLGLLIIDEEQRFGVNHKEKIKDYKNNIDVLTLSATPIPRTLQMSMAGIKSLSLIETPPLDRYPVQTYVLPENNQIIKDSIYRELGRSGQVFLLYNNINLMYKKSEEIQNLVPEARIVCANGQMPKHQLEKIMMDFINKQYDILICTTIIETGIDIPNVNTLIIYDADCFGLSQLYQLRGRVGRGNRIGYCYLMYSQHKILNAIAGKRLKAIKDFTELGSGFSIAARDLSIRGAGDILGSEQAGFIDSVGIELFMKLLNEEINKQSGKKISPDNPPTLPLIDVDTTISDNYVNQEELKIYIHQKISQIDSYEKLKQIEQEISDRFGHFDEKIKIYMYEELFEKNAKEIGIKEIRQTKNSIQVFLPKEMVNNLKIDQLFIDLSQLSKMFRFSMYGTKLVITLDTIKLDRHFTYYLIDFLDILKKDKNL